MLTVFGDGVVLSLYALSLTDIVTVNLRQGGHVFELVCWLVGWLVGGSVGRSVSQSVGWFVSAALIKVIHDFSWIFLHLV